MKGAHSHHRLRVCSSVERAWIAGLAATWMAVLAVGFFFLAQDTPAPGPEILAAIWLVLLAYRLIAVWKFGMTFSDSGLLVYGAWTRHSLRWEHVAAIEESSVQRQSMAEVFLDGVRPALILRVRRRTLWPFNVVASRGIRERELTALRELAVHHGAQWKVGDDFLARSQDSTV